MSLNDEALDDIEENKLVDEDTLVDDSLNNINLAQEAFKDITTKIANLNSYKTFRNNLLKEKYINRIGAKNYISIFGNEDNNISVEEYTNVPSKTNYDRTIKLIDRRISLEDNDITSSFAKFISEPLTGCIKALYLLKSYEVSKIEELINQIRSSNYSFLEDEYSFKNSIVIYENQPIDILTIDIETLDMTKVQINELKLEDDLVLNKAIENIKALMKFHIFKVFVLSCINNDNIKTILVNPNYSEYMTKSVTLKDILEFNKVSLKTDYLYIIKELISDLLKDCADNLDSVDKIDDDITKTALNLNDVRTTEEIILNEAYLTSTIKAMKDLITIMYGYPRIFINSQHIFSFISKL